MFYAKHLGLFFSCRRFYFLALAASLAPHFLFFLSFFFFDTRNIHQSRRFGCLCVYERGREMGQQHEERNESRMFDFIFFVLFYLFPFRTRLHPWRPRAFPFTQTCRWDILFPQFFVCLGFSSFSLSTTRNSYNTKSPIVFLFIFSLLFRTTWKYQGLYWKRRGREEDTSGIRDSFFRSLYSFVSPSGTLPCVLWSFPEIRDEIKAHLILSSLTWKLCNFGFTHRASPFLSFTLDLASKSATYSSAEAIREGYFIFDWKALSICVCFSANSSFQRRDGS